MTISNTSFQLWILPDFHVAGNLQDSAWLQRGLHAIIVLCDHVPSVPLGQTDQCCEPELENIKSIKISF